MDRTGRASSREAWLARAGFTDAASAARLLDSADLSGGALDDTVLAAVGRSADPNRALVALGRLLDAVDDRTALVAALSEDERLLGRFAAVLGLSTALADHLVRHPQQWHSLADVDAHRRPGASELRATMLDAVGADSESATPVAAGPELDALRVAYRRQLLEIAALDLADGMDVARVSAELADLAAATLEAG
ncbi:MAG TPA: hypothetical protein VIQ02_21175, partial [Jiangellaceae bacterium]